MASCMKPEDYIKDRTVARDTINLINDAVMNDSRIWEMLQQIPQETRPDFYGAGLKVCDALTKFNAAAKVYDEAVREQKILARNRVVVSYKL
jgi:hypothetical protein